MKIKLAMNCGYVGTEYEEEIEVDDNTTERELEDIWSTAAWRVCVWNAPIFHYITAMSTLSSEKMYKIFE